jgi:hypothetical protein
MTQHNLLILDSVSELFRPIPIDKNNLRSAISNQCVLDLKTPPLIISQPLYKFLYFSDLDIFKLDYKYDNQS